MIFIIRFSALQISSKLVYFLLWLFLIFFFFLLRIDALLKPRLQDSRFLAYRLGLNNNGSFGFV